ncbi:hypothetical protein F4780DRAFT_210262 [Xylariomycetidae sp. FL0641]|nr:hypothetical protein F4780DRAFT_210262 [Xylariomycetidae sp. FL0641]
MSYETTYLAQLLQISLLWAAHILGLILQLWWPRAFPYQVTHAWRQFLQTCPSPPWSPDALPLIRLTWPEPVHAGFGIMCGSAISGSGGANCDLPSPAQLLPSVLLDRWQAVDGACLGSRNSVCFGLFSDTDPV